MTAKEQRFCEEYLIDLNATQAAIRSGYSEKSAKEIGYENLTKPHIAEEIQRLQSARAEKTGLTAERVLRELGRLAFSDVRKLFDESGDLKKVTELDDDTAAAVVGVDITEHLVGGDDDKVLVRTKKYKFADKKGSLDSAMRHLGIQGADKQEHSFDVSNLSDEELNVIERILIKTAKP